MPRLLRPIGFELSDQLAALEERRNRAFAGIAHPSARCVATRVAYSGATRAPGSGERGALDFAVPEGPWHRSESTSVKAQRYAVPLPLGGSRVRNADSTKRLGISSVPCHCGSATGGGRPSTPASSAAPWSGPYRAIACRRARVRATGLEFQFQLRDTSIAQHRFKFADPLRRCLNSPLRYSGSPLRCLNLLLRYSGPLFSAPSATPL